jgi:integration host factor subunit alpha
MALTKESIAESIQRSTGVSFGQAYQLVETTLETIKNTLASGEDLLVSGFGKFKVRAKDTRRGRNPQTGEAVMLKSRKVVTFQCSGKLRERMNKRLSP